MNKHIRDAVLFFSGLAGIFYETIWQKVDRPQLLVIFAAMVGLPAFLRGDERVMPPEEHQRPTRPRKPHGPR